jgi:hypothetical protein
MLAAALLLWVCLAAWLFWLYQSERVYAQGYLDYVAAHASVPVYHPGDVVSWKDERKVLFAGWYGPEASIRWSSGQTAGLLFRLPSDYQQDQAYKVILHVAAIVTSTQRLTLMLNHDTLGSTTLHGASTLSWTVPGRILKAGINTVELQLPDAAQPSLMDARLLAVALRDFDLEPDRPAAP